MFDYPDTTIDSTVEELRQRCYEQEQIIEQLSGLLGRWLEYELADVEYGVEPTDPAPSTLIADTAEALYLADTGEVLP